MAKTIIGICPYCGNTDELTEDHVIPQCLFPNGIPADAPKVFACRRCNHVVKSELDAYLRDFLVTDMSSSESPLAHQLLPKFERAVGRNQSKMAKDVLRNNQLEELHTQSGIIIGMGFTSQAANNRITSILSMIVRGLYHYHTGKMLPQDVSFDCVRVRDHSRIKLQVRLLHCGGAPYICVGDGSVFEGLYLESPDQPYKSGWLLIFNRRIAFEVFTGFKITKQVG